MCLSPITLRRESINGTSYVQVPCGKCMECVKKFQNSWYIRFKEEFKTDHIGIFFTLTYQDNEATHRDVLVTEGIPKLVNKDTGEYFYHVSKDHIQNWIKRYRTDFKRKHGYNSPLKYFITSEYGPKTGRPHYHGVFFHVNLYDDGIQELFNDWRTRYGFVKCDNINSFKFGGAMRYVSKYCLKPSNFESVIPSWVSFSEQPKAKNFRLISKRLGFNYIETLKSALSSILTEHGAKCLRFFPFKFRNYSTDTALTFRASSTIKSTLFDDITKAFKYHETYTKCGQSLQVAYSLPRYYCDKIVAPKSALSLAYKDYLLRRRYEDTARADQLDIDFCIGLGLSYPSKVLYDARARIERAYRSFAEFYRKSVF